MFNFFSELKQKFNILNDNINDYNIINVNSNLIYIEGHKGIMNFNKELISVKINKGVICLEGKEMYIKELDKNTILIKGDINKVERF